MAAFEVISVDDDTLRAHDPASLRGEESYQIPHRSQWQAVWPTGYYKSKHLLEENQKSSLLSFPPTFARKITFGQ